MFPPVATVTVPFPFTIVNNKKLVYTTYHTAHSLATTLYTYQSTYLPTLYKGTLTIKVIVIVMVIVMVTRLPIYNHLIMLP